MRRVRIKVIDDDIKALYVGDQDTEMTFTVADINAMVDELRAMPAYRQNSRGDIIWHLVEKTLGRIAEKSYTAPRLTPEETEAAAMLVIRECGAMGERR